MCFIINEGFILHRIWRVLHFVSVVVPTVCSVLKFKNFFFSKSYLSNRKNKSNLTLKAPDMKLRTLAAAFGQQNLFYVSSCINTKTLGNKFPLQTAVNSCCLSYMQTHVHFWASVDTETEALPAVCSEMSRVWWCLCTCRCTQRAGGCGEVESFTSVVSQHRAGAAGCSVTTSRPPRMPCTPLQVSLLASSFSPTTALTFFFRDEHSLPVVM